MLYFVCHFCLKSCQRECHSKPSRSGFRFCTPVCQLRWLGKGPAVPRRDHWLRSGDPIPTGAPRRIVDANGYAVLYWTVARKHTVRVFEHKLVAGMPPVGYVVHHKNGIKDDNRPENLEVLTQSDHARLHRARTWDIAAAAAARAGGRTLKSIAIEHGVHRSTIARALCDHVANAGGVPMTDLRRRADGGLADTERRHSADCRAQEARRTAEAEALEAEHVRRRAAAELKESA